MGMGYGANFAEVISSTHLAQIVGVDKMKRFATELDKADSSEYNFVIDGYQNPEHTEIEEAYTDIVETFNKVTGLEIYLNYHDSGDNGSRYDDVDGPFWSVDGMYQLTEAGKKYRDVVNRAFYVTFG